MNYSVLMSIYYKEKPENLRQSMNSIFAQTTPTNDFVLVCDGPLNAALDAEIAAQQEKFDDRLRVVRLTKNEGLGRALNEGLKHCRNDLVARMDSDDISRPCRCEKQLTVFIAHPEISILGGAVEEFSITPNQVDSIRMPPETHEQIKVFSKERNPFNHPCVMYRKSAVEAAGGYQDFYLLEDYYLWLRMLMNGAIGHNLQEPLLWMRAGSDLYKRRAGWEYAKAQRELFRFMKNNSYIKTGAYVKSCIIRTLSSLAPNTLRQVVFKRKLRKRTETEPTKQM